MALTQPCMCGPVQEIRCRLWYVLLENPHLAAHIQVGLVHVQAQIPQLQYATCIQTKRGQRCAERTADTGG